MPSLCVFAPATMDLSEQPRTGAAQRRKQRRLRSWWRHEQQSIAAALATSLHHSSRGQKKARAGEEESETKYTAKFRTILLLSRCSSDEEPGGRRPASLAEPPGAQERVPRHTMEQFGELAPMVQILDAPVPQLVDKLEDVLKIVDLPVPALEIEVPKTSSLSCPPPRRVLPVPQTTEQLV